MIQADPSTRATARRAWPLLLAFGLSSLGIGLSQPIVPLFSLELGASAVAVGFVLSARWASRLVVDMPLGALSERRGRSSVFAVGVALVAIAGTISALSPTWEWLLVARMVEGVGVGATTTAGLAAAADMSTARTRARMIGWYQSAQLLGFWFGPLIGGAVGGLFGLRAPLMLYAVIASVAILPALLVRDHVASPRHTGSHRAAFGALFRSRDFLLIALVSFVVFFTMTGALMTAMPLFAANQLAAGPGFVGVALFLASTVGFLLLYPTGLISDRRGRRGVVVVLLIATALALLVMAFAQSPAIVLAAVLGLGAGNALRGPATAAYVMDAGRHAGFGATAGAFRALGDIGSTLGPVVASLTFALSDRAFFMVDALIALVAGLVFWRFASANPGVQDDSDKPEMNSPTASL